MHLVVCYYLLIFLLMILISAMLKKFEMLSGNRGKSCIKSLILK